MNETDINKTVVSQVDDGRTQMATAPASNATQYAANVDCPVCHTPNPPSETFCTDCGFLLNSAPAAIADQPVAASMGKLVTADGTREFPLQEGANSVGRESSDVLLTNNTISRKHATVTVSAGVVYVEDAGSTNGTYVDGKRIGSGEKADLRDGSDVVFGSMTMKYEAPAAAEPQPSTDLETEAPGDAEPSTDVEAEAPIDTEPSTDSEGEAPAEPPAEPEKMPVARLISADGVYSFELFEGRNTIGRRDGVNDIVVPDPYCSSHHADVVFENGMITVTDAGSTNGTLVNGAKLEPDIPHEIQLGDEITAGRVVFKLEGASHD